MDAPHTSPRLARKRTATTDANERNGTRTRAAYSVRAAHRSERTSVRAELRSLVR